MASRAPSPQHTLASMSQAATSWEQVTLLAQMGARPGTFILPQQGVLLPELWENGLWTVLPLEVCAPSGLTAHLGVD